jgi:peptide/nickel transport system substrate-binding protein
MRVYKLVCVAVLAAGCVFLQTPSQAKDLRTNINADPEMIDPITFSALIAGDVLRNVYEGFTDGGRTGKPLPALATKWEPHPDNLGWRFELRKGVKFHTGKPFTAKDVKASFEALLAPGSKAGLQLQYLQRVEGAKEVQAGTSKDLTGIKVVDDNTLDVRFTAPDILFPIYPFMIFDTSVVAEKGPNWFNEVSAGTGPFKFVEWRRGQDVKLAAFKDYWGGAPAIDGIRFIIVPSEETAITMYEAGELDVLKVESTDLNRRIMRDDKLKAQAQTTAAAQITYLGMNQNLFAPFKDKRVREAFYKAIDIETIKSRVMRGMSTPAALMIAPQLFSRAGDFVRPKYDVDGAKKLLADAGYPNGFEVGMDCPNDRYVNDEAICQAAVGMLARAGGKVNLMAQPKAQYFGKVLKSGNYNTSFYLLGWTPGTFDSHNVLFDIEGCRNDPNSSRGESNLGNFCNKQHDELTDKILVESNKEKRDQMIKEAFQTTFDEYGYIPLHQQALAWGVSNKVTMVQRADNQVLFYWAQKKE